MPADINSTTRLTRYFRISRVIAHVFIGVTIISVVFPFLSAPPKLRVIKWWHQALLNAFNLRISAHGHVPSHMVSSTMVVANHISWLDVHALNSFVSLRFIAKSELSKWPVFGYLAKNADVLFINRDNRRDAARVANMTAESLRAGDNLCLFPEGTTTDGSTIAPFKSSIIQAAIEANANIQAVAIRYPHPDGGSNTAMAYAGDTTMKQSFAQILQQQAPIVELHFLVPIITANLAEEAKNRRDLTMQIEQKIRATLGL